MGVTPKNQHNLLIELYQLAKEKEWINSKIGYHLRKQVSLSQEQEHWDYIGTQTDRLGEIRKRTLIVLNSLNEFDLECTQK